MANHFYGTAVHEHAEKDVKDLKPIDWCIFIGMFVLFIGASVSFAMGNIVLGIILIGIFFMMFDICARVIFHLKSRITPIFSVIGVYIILGGVLVFFRGLKVLIPYVTLGYSLVWLIVGIFCWRLGSKKRRMRKKYTRVVDAECMIVDYAKIRMFRKDLPMYSSLSYATVKKPAFHYYVNGKEYYVESTVYYGDLNKGFQEGNRVKLLTDPYNPQDYIPEIDAPMMETFMGVFGIVLGGCCLIAWIVLMILGILTF